VPEDVKQTVEWLTLDGKISQREQAFLRGKDLKRKEAFKMGDFMD
jgi:hypothetical protein